MMEFIEAIFKNTSGFVFGFAVGLGLCVGLVLDNNETHHKIIKHGCAQYNHITGDFEWKDSPNEQ